MTLRAVVLPLLAAVGLILMASPVEATAGEKGFVVLYGTAKVASNRAIEKELRQSGLLESMASFLNRNYRWPRELQLRGAECNKVNAFYSQSLAAVTVCYEFVTHLQQLFTGAKVAAADVQKRVHDTLVFTLHHEVGHAMEDEWDLAFTGKSEDAADELAALMLLRRQNGARFVASAATWFALASKPQLQRLARGDKMLLWDSHSLSSQRYYELVCLLYGRQPKLYVDQLVKLGIDAKRRTRCVEDYRRRQRAWSTILKPHLKIVEEVHAAPAPAGK